MTPSACDGKSCHSERYEGEDSDGRLKLEEDAILQSRQRTQTSNQHRNCGEEFRALPSTFKSEILRAVGSSPAEYTDKKSMFLKNM
ncbi:hypothetical protein J3D54_005155 [Pseudomonas sp. GGS8]|nr:hypothetical protein [Pseudomonas sp. GGS8]